MRRILRQRPVPHRAVEQGAENRVRSPNGGFGESATLQLDLPRVDVGRPKLVKRFAPILALTMCLRVIVAYIALVVAFAI
jgi:hypothetical protein